MTALEISNMIKRTLKQHIHHWNISQKTLCEKLGKSRNRVSGILSEKNSHVLTFRNFCDLCNTLEIGFVLTYNQQQDIISMRIVGKQELGGIKPMIVPKFV